MDIFLVRNGYKGAAGSEYELMGEWSTEKISHRGESVSTGLTGSLFVEADDHLKLVAC